MSKLTPVTVQKKAYTKANGTKVKAHSTKVRKNLTPTAASLSGPTAGAPKTSTKAQRELEQAVKNAAEMQRTIARLTEYAADIESAWAGVTAPKPSPNRKLVESRLRIGQPESEFEYAADVQLVLEDLGAELGFTGAREAVLRNRQSLSNARDVGSTSVVVGLAVLGMHP